MKKYASLLLALLTIALALLLFKQRGDYGDLKDQRAALRQEVEDLKIQRARALDAVEREKAAFKRTDNMLGVARKHYDHQSAQLKQAQTTLNGFIFRGQLASRGQQTYWQVLEISSIPNPAETIYKDCLVSVKLKAQPHVKWKAAATSLPDRIITGIAWGFQDRILGTISPLKTNDVILCETIAEADMDPTIKTLQLVDEIGDLEADIFYLAHVTDTGTEPVRKIPIAPPFDQAVTREASIAADLQRIDELLAAHGGWEAWFAETRPYRNQLQALMDETGGPLNHENRIYFPTVDPLDLQPSQEYPQLHVEVIKALRDQLKAKNIELIVAPVPTKEMVNACFFLKNPPADHVVNPYRLLLFKQLLEADIEVIDFLDPLMAALDTYPHVFYDALDSHPADGAIQTVAEVLGQRLARYRFPPVNETLHAMQTRYRVHARFFEPRSGVGFPYIATRLFHENMEPLDEAGGDDSPILMITDSFAGVPGHYNVWSANIPSHIYKEIGVLPQKYQQNMGGPLVLQNFPLIPESHFENAKVCVFLFGEFYLAFPDDIRVRWVGPKK
ncbi:MAG: hypothetical protein ACI9QL_003532 [Candidatus Omnitrophota bacterium]|jgi:hypothetical protein